MICYQTTHIFPPIPLRDFDWCAVSDSYEGGDPIGYGRTQQEAIDNLHEMIELLGRDE